MRSVHTTIVILTLFYISLAGVAVGSLVACNSLTSLLTSQFCHNYDGPVVLLNASFNVATDFWILLLPLPLVAKLQLRLQQKVGLFIVFAAGLGACAASLARLIELAIHYRNEDLVWVEGTNAEFSVVEINIGIIVACVPCFPVFFARTRDWFRATSASNHTPVHYPEPADGPTEREARQQHRDLASSTRLISTTDVTNLSSHILTPEVHIT
ncbi:hypothetical protein F5Y19DRAFT_431656 [Xylariaceae sp. FL1651]|nr:hypothetical protein F5Y19DRAFT_431656 [Xylariaceae sp. FL1651]